MSEDFINVVKFIHMKFGAKVATLFVFILLACWAFFGVERISYFIKASIKIIFFTTIIFFPIICVANLIGQWIRRKWMKKEKGIGRFICPISETGCREDKKFCKNMGIYWGDENIGVTYYCKNFAHYQFSKTPEEIKKMYKIR
jgi:hypothetical protein